ncbi:WD40-repeat-containing domain protein, partial [Pisolithus croceorrhizus]
QLCNFANAARHLGSSVGILSSASKLRDRLTNIMFLLRENAACLFPRQVIRHSREGRLNPDVMDDDGRRAAWRRHRPLPLDDNLQPETLPSHLGNFADDVKNFVKCLNEFPEFDDVAVNQSMIEFEGNLRYWAVHLKEYTNQFRSAAVQRYVHDLTSEIGYHVDNVTVTLAMFIEIGVPTISSHQQHAAANLLNLSTVATFFSGVTATTLQFSYSTTSGKLADIVNTLWFSSLVFSIAAAVNSLLGLTWKQAMYRSPGHRVPWWVSIWIKRSPLVFLVMSIASFSAGLMLFTYSSGQGSVTSTIITAITSFGLAAVSAWFASERWIFVRHSGQKWLGDVIAEFMASVTNLRIVRGMRITMKWCNTCFLSMRAFLRRFSRAVRVTMIRENAVLPRHNQPDQPQAFRHPCPTSSHHTDFQEPKPPLPNHDVAISSSESVTPSALSDRCSDRNITHGNIDARQRFVNAVRTVIMLGAASRPSSALEIAELGMPRRSANGFVKWDMLAPVMDQVAHQALVRHLQFSPNGKLLATAGWDKKSVLFRVTGPRELTAHRVLFNGKGLIGQVAWSPNGQEILVRLPRAVRVWSEDGVCMRSIVREQPIQSVAWLPNGEGFLSVEGSNVVRIVRGDIRVSDTYNLGQIQLCGVAVTQDCVRLVGVGPSITREGGPHPSCHIRVEKRIIVYNMVTKTKESQTPLADDIRDVAMARKRPLVLLSLEKVSAPPQIWRLEIIKDRDRDCTTSRITLKHAFVTKIPVEYAGSCCFGGCDDQFVVCAGKIGDVHVWDRDSAALLHFISPQSGKGDLACIGWNGGLKGLKTAMFATGSHHGMVRVWSTEIPVDERDEESLDEP